MRILLLEDDSSYAESIQNVLQERGYEVLMFSDGSRLIRYLEDATADLLILDWGVRGISGIDVLWWVRKRIGRSLPVIFVTSRSLEEQLVMALEAGADDYIVKPIRIPEFAARVSALLRRSYPEYNATQSRLQVGPYTIDVPNQSITLGSEIIGMTPREFEVAFVLFTSFGQIVPREYLIKRVWGRDYDKNLRSLDTHIYRIRQKLRINASTGMRLRVIYAHGYRLESSMAEEAAGDR